MSTAQDMYAANLRQAYGYPLHSPEPRKQLPEPYPSSGFEVGDVGYINREGEFIPLFNIRLPPWHPCDVLFSYEPVGFSEPDRKPLALAKGHVFMSGVKRDVDASSSATYKFVAKSNAGAILILPSGATLVDLKKKDLEKFRQTASKYAQEWCQTWKDDSLYLVTGLYKTRNFTLASFNSGDPGEKLLVEQEGTGTYEWTCAFETYFRTSPQNNNYENQTVFIKGFRMTMRWSRLPVIEQVTGSQSPIIRWFASLWATLFALLEALFTMIKKWLSRLSRSMLSLDAWERRPSVAVEHNPQLSQPLHPSDIINRYLLDKNPSASVAITHDNEWIDMLKKERLLPEDLMQEDRLRCFLEKEYALCSDDIVYLQSQIGHTDDIHDNFTSSRLMSAIGNVQIVITHIRAESLAVGLKRVPVGFYIQVDIPGRPSRRTEIKSIPVYDRAIQWNDQIHLPLGTSMVKLTVFESFEFNPMLGRGKLLYTLETSMGELLHRTHPFTLSEQQGEDVSPCASLLVVVQEWDCNHRRHCSSNVDGTVDREEFPWLTQVMKATDDGHDALLRYHEDYCGEDLKCSVTHFERALACCPEESPHRAAALFNLATAEFMTSQLNGTSYNFNKFIPRYREALRLRRGGHRDRPMTLLYLAQAILYRYRIEGSSADELCKLVDELKDVCPEGTHARRSTDLVVQTYERLKLRDSNDLNKVTDLISELDMAAQELPDVYFDRPIRFNNLGLALQRRFQLRREAGLGDLDRAIECLEKAIRIIPDNHPSKSNYASDLGNALWVRTHGVGLLLFRKHGNLFDLQQAISVLETFIRSISPLDGRYPVGLANLGVALSYRFDRLGDLNDLEEAISKLQDAVDLTPADHPDQAGHLNNLGTSFRTRFNRFGEIGDLREAISRQQDAVDLTPNDHPDKPGFLNNLGTSFRTLFERFGEIPDLEEAVSRQQNAVDLTPDGHPDKAGYLNNLGTSFRIRFERFGEISDLEEAILRQQDAVHLTPQSHPEQPGHLNNLGTSFRIRFDRLGEIRDLEEAIMRQQDAVDFTPDDHPDKAGYLSNLGTSFRTRFERFGEMSDLEEAILRQQKAVDLTPESHPDKARRLKHHGNSLRTRFERIGEIRDLEEAISRQQSAVDLTPTGHPDKPGCLNNLGISFRARFGRLEEIRDLEEAISRQQDAVNLTPDGHPDKPGYLNNLGTSFRTRFKRLGEIHDLEEAVSRQQDAADCTPSDHPDKPGFLDNLGTSFRTRFERLGEIRDLEEAILRQQDAVYLTPDGHPDKPGYLNSLGTSLRTRFERLGEISNLGEAVSRQQEAVDLTPNDHPDKPRFLNNLGTSFRTRFECLREIRDLEEAISKQQYAVALTPDGHPDKSGHLNNLGASFLTRFKHFGEITSLGQAMLSLSLAALSPAGPVTVRFHASRRWIDCALILRHESLLHAYSAAINLFSQLAWIGLSLAHRYRELARAADVVRDAAAAALESGFPEVAVEWLEQGRSVVWSELLQLRSSYDQLASAYPDHARRLRELSAALEYAGSAREKSLSDGSDLKSLQFEADQHRKLAIERDALLQDIRRLPGFERFLQLKEFSELRASAHSGPVVILNVAKARCDALIVLANVDHVIHVPLPNFTLDRSIELETSLGFDRDSGDDRYGYLVGKPEVNARATQWKAILSCLWKCVVKPVLDALAFSTPGELSRIFWCPTGPLAFLPIHAAGFYDDAWNSEPGHKVLDFVISSYIPTLSILAITPISNTASNNDLRLLAVRQPPSDGQIPLPGAVTELEHIKTVLRNSPSARITLIESSVGTVEEVLALMKEADWVHFACHGIQDDGNPTHSGLCLANERRLKISDIHSLSRPHGGLAFLSACQTAKGDKTLSDEAIHIAAGMLFAGYGGVIAMMGSIRDRIAPDVAKDVYEQLFHQNDTGIPDHRDAARALHVAVGRLREKNVPFEQWLPFIHVGL